MFKAWDLFKHLFKAFQQKSNVCFLPSCIPITTIQGPHIMKDRLVHHVSGNTHMYNTPHPTSLLLIYLICHLHHCFPHLPGGLLTKQIYLKINETICVTDGYKDGGFFPVKQGKKYLFSAPLLRCETCQTAFKPCRHLIPREKWDLSPQ